MIEETLENLKSQVESTLIECPGTRNSDIELTIKIWERFHNARLGWDGAKRWIYIEQLFELPREDNVKRIRAKFNSEGLYWPTDPKVAQARGILQDDWMRVLGYTGQEWTTTQTIEPRTGDGETPINPSETLI
jgi:hypothetical protein